MALEIDLSIELLDYFSPLDFLRLYNKAIDKKKEFFNLLSIAVQVGYINANSKKKVQMFEDTDKDTGSERARVTKISEEEKSETLDFIDSF